MVTALCTKNVVSFLEDKGKKLSSETSNDIHLTSSPYLHNNTNCLQTFTKHFHILNRVSSSYIVPPATGEQLNNEKSQQHKIESRRDQVYIALLVETPGTSWVRLVA